MHSPISNDLERRLTSSIKSAVWGGLMEESERFAVVAISLRREIDVKLSTDQQRVVEPDVEVQQAAPIWHTGSSGDLEMPLCLLIESVAK
ncbi:hypothetical protein ACFVUS_29515 [Nocardia sp. NPDC058058]|uniref:hypothetical protein n=1 Tax=Nocardia sp. NPDC058058 TaxID=3346317 RepID=UPI0036DCE002